MTRPIRTEHFQGCVDWWGGNDRKGRIETDFAWRVTIREVKERKYNLDITNPHVAPLDHDDPTELLEKLDAAEAFADSLRDQLRSSLEQALLR